MLGDGGKALGQGGSSRLLTGFLLGLQEYRWLGISSKLGPLWPTIGLALKALFIGYVFSTFLESGRSDYLPWVVTGWATWQLISSSLDSGIDSIYSARKIMLSLPIPLEVPILGSISKNLLLFIQNLVVVAMVLFAFQVKTDWVIFLAVPGLLITCSFLVAFSMVFAPLACRYRDFRYLVSSILGVMFFTLPIIWAPENIGNSGVMQLLQLNPIYHYLQIVRLPLLSEIPDFSSYIISVLLAVATAVVGKYVANKTRKKITYWL